MIESLNKGPQNDNCYSVVWFEDTKDELFSIIAELPLLELERIMKIYSK